MKERDDRGVPLDSEDLAPVSQLSLVIWDALGSKVVDRAGSCEIGKGKSGRIWEISLILLSRPEVVTHRKLAASLVCGQLPLPSVFPLKLVKHPCFSKISLGVNDGTAAAVQRRREGVALPCTK